MAKKRVFISFDCDHDSEARDLLVGQAKSPDSPFDIADASVKEAPAGDWRETVRRRMDRVDAVIVLCGEYTDKAEGVAAELRIAQEEGKEYFLLGAYPDKHCTRPTTAKEEDKIYKWGWGNVKMLMAGWGGKGATRLINHAQETYGGSFHADLLAQYIHYVESAEMVSERRVVANNYMLAANSSLVTLYGILAATRFGTVWLALLPFAGFFVALTWHKVIRFYRNLNKAKFEVIHELEVMTPAAPYRYEWEKAGGSKSKGYRLLSCSGDWIPLVFMLLYLVLFAVGVIPVILRYAT